MFDFTPSQYYRNYCREHGIEITDRALAAAIFSERLGCLERKTVTLEERFEALKKIAAETGDGELKALISEVIEDGEAAFDNLKKGGENSFYELTATILLPRDRIPPYPRLPSVSEDLYEYEIFYFYDYDTAYNYALSHTEELGTLDSFKIMRHRIFTGTESPKTSHWGESAYFNSSGELYLIYGGKERAHRELRAFYTAVDPFNELDIVIHCRSGELGIVRDSEGNHEGEILILFEDGFTKSVSPMCLEKIDRDSEPALRGKAAKVIREQLKRFKGERRAALEKTASELADT